MSQILTVGFDFQENSYYSLINVKKIASETVYKITVMNETLEKLLFGNNVIKEKDGHLNVEILGYGRQEELKIKIAEALSTLLNKPLAKELKFDKFY